MTTPGFAQPLRPARPCVQHRPFLPFSSSKTDGLGIGLSLCRTLIEAHSCRIWLDVNSPGAAIHFTLPVAKSPAAKR